MCIRDSVADLASSSVLLRRGSGSVVCVLGRCMRFGSRTIVSFVFILYFEVRV